jgi:hypothetical protein
MRRQSCLHTLLTALTLATLALLSQQSQAELAPILDTTSHSEWVAPTVTTEGRVRVIITKTKAKLHLPKTQRPVIRLSLEDDDSDYYDELPDLQIGYRRPELVDQTAEVEDISDEIKIRLAIARLKALEAYNKKWG